MKKKSDLPEKMCVVCNRPFQWRKKWEKVWDDVKYCSKACAGRKHTIKRKTSAGQEEG
ncbi:MAG: DUF2256 domain-containing protein [Rhodobacteraceae bacterium]|jgi:hypothetical protein|nr:DUF2256 domain-containing protein [Paracoccaceae bacterium]